MTTKQFSEQEMREFLGYRDPAEQRFGVTLVDIDVAADRAVMDMPFGRLCHPGSAVPSLGLLTMLIDAAGGAANFAHFRGDQWSVTSELSLDLGSSAASALGPDSPGVVRCDARTITADESTAIAVCPLTVEGTEVGVGTVRSYATPVSSRIPEWLDDPSGGADDGDLLAMLALGAHESGSGTAIFLAGADDTLHNSMGVVHGGVVSAALEVAAVAAACADPAAWTTGSIRVNYLRPMVTGAGARYEGTVLRAGRTTTIADARALNADGKVAATARITAYVAPD